MSIGDGGSADDSYQVRLAPRAVRSLSKLPPRVSEPIVAFVFGSLAESPRRRGKPLERDLKGLWSARRGDFRVIYEIHETDRLVLVVNVGHRSDIYRAS